MRPKASSRALRNSPEAGLDDQINELEKSGAADTAAKLREKWKARATANDTLKAESPAHAKKLSQAEKDLAKDKADLASSGKGTDERLTKLQKERDDFKTAAEQRASEFDSFKLRVELADKLGISDAKVRKRALDAFLADYRPEARASTTRASSRASIRPSRPSGPPRASTGAASREEAPRGGGRAGSDPKNKPHTPHPTNPSETLERVKVSACREACGAPIRRQPRSPVRWHRSDLPTRAPWLYNGCVLGYTRRSGASSLELHASLLTTLAGDVASCTRPAPRSRRPVHGRHGLRSGQANHRARPAHRCRPALGFLERQEPGQW